MDAEVVSVVILIDIFCSDDDDDENILGNLATSMIVSAVILLQLHVIRVFVNFFLNISFKLPHFPIHVLPLFV